MRPEGGRGGGGRVPLTHTHQLTPALSEAEALRAAVKLAQDQDPSLKPAAKMGLAEYIASLPPKQRDRLTEGIEPATVEAMQRLVRWVVGEVEIVGHPDKKGNLTLDRNSLASLCLWQLVLGYKVRGGGGRGVLLSTLTSRPVPGS